MSGTNKKEFAEGIGERKMRSDYLNSLLNGEFEKAEKLRVESIPTKLIKFVWLDGSSTDEKKFQTLRNNELWFSHASRVNDPFEFKGLYLDREKLKNAGYSQELIDKFEECFDVSEELGVTCLSANEIDFLPMWAYYTNNYRGFCVEYDVLNPSRIFEVSYEPQRVGTASLFLSYFDAVKKGRLDQAYHHGMIFRSIFFMKSQSWQHEKEYRILNSISNEIGENVKIDVLGLRVNRIVAGINTTDRDISALNEISNQIGCGNVYLSGLHPNTYGLEIHSLECSVDAE